MDNKEQIKNPVTVTLQPSRAPGPPEGAPDIMQVRNKAGRPKGSQNKVTSTFRDAMLLAARELGDTQEVGKDGQGGLLGYLKVCGVLERKTFMLMMARILPLKISTEVKRVKEKISLEEAVAELKECGLDEMLAFYLKRNPIEPDEENTAWADMIDLNLEAPDPVDMASEIDVTLEDGTEE